MSPVSDATNQPLPVPKVKSKVDLDWEAAAPLDVNNKQFVLDAWKQVVDVQMHFNDICMKIRNIAITMLAAAVALAAYSTKEGVYWTVIGVSVPMGSIVALAGAVGWIAFYGMDRHWYHVFLGATSKHANRIEARWKNDLPELMLSSQISETSSRVILGIELKSYRRLDIFYLVGLIVLVVTGVVVWGSHPAQATPVVATQSTVTPATTPDRTESSVEAISPPQPQTTPSPTPDAARVPDSAPTAPVPTVVTPAVEPATTMPESPILQK